MTTPSASLQALLTDSLDYAGSFPPANLPGEIALRQYARHRLSEHAWMLGRFVCSAQRLTELEPHLKALGGGQPLRMAVVGRPSEARDDLLAGFAQDLELMTEFLTRLGAGVRIEFLETPLPQDVIRDRLAVAWFLKELRQRLDEVPGSPRTVFFELPRASDLTAASEKAIEEFAMRSGGGIRFGLKIRAGGPTAAAFPAPDLVARLIEACCEVECIWKATAGLHHPLSGFDPELTVWRFGFLNLVTAATLTQAHGLSPPQIESVLRESTADAWSFTQDALVYRSYSASLAQVAAARKTAFISFGSCSFEEPVERLQAWIGL